MTRQRHGQERRIRDTSRGVALGAISSALLCLPLGATAQETREITDETELVTVDAGGINGRIVDATNGEPILEGTLDVLDHDLSTTTDDQGRFTLQLAPGVYVLRATCPLYHSTRIERVRVGARRRELEVRMEPDTDAIIEVAPVVARGNNATEATQLQIRRRSAAVQDAVSAEEMSRSPDGSAGDSVRRVVAASLVDGQFLLVRGLGGRYTNVLLNGVPLPSLDPDYPGPQLDLLPSGLLESIAVLKTFTPELFGDFAGGSMLITTRSYPEDFTLRTSVSLGYNTESTFRRALRHEGGSLEVIGFDDGTRALPAEIPSRRIETGRNDFANDDVERFGESFTDI